MLNPYKSYAFPRFVVFFETRHSLVEEPYARLRKKKLDFVTSALRCEKRGGFRGI